jgi:hypothetical protein
MGVPDYGLDPDWWLAQENVESVEQDRSDVSVMTGRKLTPNSSDL